MIAASEKTVYCWAMGLVQHKNGVANVKEISNLAFLRGDIGKPGAGLFPVRGHSNVQGDRTMGIWERAPEHFLDALRDEFGFEPPREHGFDAVAAVKAFRDGKAKVFFGMGGNFVAAMSDTDVTEDALRNAELTVHVSTKPNRSHVVHGREALILPALGRSEKDLAGGRPQRVTVEDSLCSVHASHGPLAPASPHLKSEVDIVCSMAEATLGDRHAIPWSDFRADYSEIRRRIARVVPGCAGYDEKVDQPGGFVLPHPPRDTRTFPTKHDRAIFSVSPTEVLHVPEGRLLLQTMRSHDQFNTTIYGLDDRYRGISGGRRVVFVHPDDIVRWGSRTGRSSTSSASGRTGRSGWRRASAWSPTTRRAAAPGPTTPRPTRWCRSTPRPRAATSPPSSRSSSGSSRPATTAPVLVARRPCRPTARSGVAVTRRSARCSPTT